MTKVYGSPDWTLVHIFKSVLESYGIPCEVKAEFPIGTRATIPITELWVLDESKVDEARSILAQSEKKDQQSADSWKCGKCGELIEAQFDQCWQCGNRRPYTRT